MPARSLSASQVTEWLSPAVTVPSRYKNVWAWEDSLASLSTLTVGSGTWTINGGVLECAAPGDDVGTKIQSKNQIDTGKDTHIIEVDLKASSAFTTGTEAHTGIGFNTSGFGSNLVFSQMRYTGGHTVAFLSDGIAWRNSAGSTFTADQWYRLRLRWEDATDTFTVWRDGVLYTSQVIAQTEGALYPTLMCYRKAGTAPTFNYRNLKYWGGTVGASEPPL